MKLVDIAEFYAPTAGGVRTYVDQKIAVGAELGHEVVVVAPGPRDYVEHRAGGRVIWVKSQALIADPNYRLFWNFSPVHAILDAERPDVVEASSPWTGAWIVAAWQGSAAKALFLHADPVAAYPYRWFKGLLSEGMIDRLFGWFWAHLRALDQRTDGMVVAGTWLRERMMRYGIREPAVAPLGVDVSAFSPQRRCPALRRRMLESCGGLPEDALLLIGLGRHHPEKRWPFIMRATAAAASRRPVGLVIVGNGMARKSIEKAAARYTHVNVAGQIDDRALLSRMLASADGLIHGSTSETFGLAPAEALASGTPIIVPAAGGAGDLGGPAHAETYRPGDLASAAAAIQRFMERDRAAMSRAAADAAERIGSPREHFERLFAIYARMAARKASLLGQQPLVAPEPAMLEEGLYRAA